MGVVLDGTQTVELITLCTPTRAISRPGRWTSTLSCLCLCKYQANPHIESQTRTLGSYTDPERRKFYSWASRFELYRLPGYAGQLYTTQRYQRPGPDRWHFC